jgi:hypothetical protein
MHTGTVASMKKLQGALQSVSTFSRGFWRYWRLGEPAPSSNHLVQKLYSFTDGRSNDILFRILESNRKEPLLRLGWDATSLVSDAGIADPSIQDAVRTLAQDGVVVLPHRLKPETVQELRDLASFGELETETYGTVAKGQASGDYLEVPRTGTGTCNGFDPSNPQFPFYGVPRRVLVQNRIIQGLLCDPYLLAVATGYLGVFPVVTKPSMWWDTDAVPDGLRPRPFHTDSGCLRWIKVGINLTDTSFETPHFVFVKGSHRPNASTRSLTKRLSNRMCLSDKEVNELCPDRIVHCYAPAGSITLADTRGIHKGELSQRGNRLILYFGLEGSAFNNLDGIIPVSSVGDQLSKAMNARPFAYQFFRVGDPAEPSQSH